MLLTVYTDESLVEVEKTVEVDKLKIPYRTSMAIIKSLDGLDLDNTDMVINLLATSTDHLDKIIKATFGVTDSDLDRVDTMELISLGKELYQWTIDKIKSLKNGGEKNARLTV